MAFFTSKANTLKALEGALQHGSVLPQYTFSVSDWHNDKTGLLSRFCSVDWSKDLVIVRSSAAGEDAEGQSNAGHYKSIPNILGQDAFQEAVDEVIASYGPNPIPESQVFIQPQLQDVVIAGVAFTKDPSTGGHYYILNFDDQTGRTDLVTSGQNGELRTVFCAKTDIENDETPLTPILNLLQELEIKTGHPSLDIEFAQTGDGTVYLLQVRPLSVSAQTALSQPEQTASLTKIQKYLSKIFAPHPLLFGKTTVLGVMPDWNPAEIIGVRPRTLALSLYKELITDNIWAYQRDNYGYKALRSFPLMVSLEGLPYIDTRISFNSFLPKDLPADLSERLVDYYVNCLADNPSQHDKVEFEIVFSCYTLDLTERTSVLRDNGFSETDCAYLQHSLRLLTNRVVQEGTGIFHRDMAKIERLARRRVQILESDLSSTEKIYWLLEDCKRFGTLPFAGAARAGFMAAQFLKSLVSTEILSAEQSNLFMRSLDTVSSQMERDLANLSRNDFLDRYGHLRPGTYDILSPRYDEQPDWYFDWDNLSGSSEDKPAFEMSAEQERACDDLLAKQGLELNAAGLLQFMRAAMEGREHAKFVFTHSLSDALVEIAKLGDTLSLTTEDMSHLNIKAIYDLYGASGDHSAVIKDSVERGRKNYQTTRQISLPPVIRNTDEIMRFELFDAEPNFITLGQAAGPVSREDTQPALLKDSIILLPNADPGFDWIFSWGIAGFITKYGGANSHMAIRSSELGIPAAIGVGEKLFATCDKAEILELNCLNKQIRTIR